MEQTLNLNQSDNHKAQEPWNQVYGSVGGRLPCPIPFSSPGPHPIPTDMKTFLASMQSVIFAHLIKSVVSLSWINAKNPNVFPELKKEAESD